MKSACGRHRHEVPKAVACAQDHDRVVEDGRGADNRLLGLGLGAVRRCDTTDLGGDQFDNGVLGARRGGQLVKERSIEAIGDDDADLAPSEGLRAVGKQAQGW